MAASPTKPTKSRWIGEVVVAMALLPCVVGAISVQEESVTSVHLAAGTWAPAARVARGALLSFRFRPEAPAPPSTSTSTAGAGAGGGVVRALLLDQTGDARVGAMYVLSLAAGARGAQLLRCHRPFGARPRAHAHALLAPWRAAARAARAPAPAARAQLVFGLPGAAPPRACHLAMQFSLEALGWAGAWAAGREYGVALDVVRGRVRVWVEGALFQWEDPLPFDVRDLQVGAHDVALRLHIDGAQRQQPHYANGNNIWCVLPKSCKCMLGFHGDFCTSLCPVGRFGESCAHACGACLGDAEGAPGACDPATGACPLGCRQGFLPPLCKQELVRLREKPVVRALNASALEVVADARRLVGVGAPHAAVVQFRPDDGLQGLREDAWQSLALMLLAPLDEEPGAGAGAEVRAVVAGLRAGADYRVRVLLLTADGAWSPRAPAATSTTACSVPDSFDYKIYAYVDPHYNKTMVRWMATGKGAARCGVRSWRVRMRAPAAGDWTREVVRREPMRGAQLEAPPAPASLTVQALTAAPAPALPPSRPQPVLATAPDVGPVQDLDVRDVEDRTATVIWKPPTCCPDVPLIYRFTLKGHCFGTEKEFSSLCQTDGRLICERLARCAEGCWERERELRVEAGQPLRLALAALRPDAVYALSAAAFLEDAHLPGPPAAAWFQTRSAAPSARPDPSLVEVQQLGSRGFTLRWHFPGNCSAANGALDGMHYAIRPAARPEGEGEGDGEGEGGARGEAAGFSGLVMGTRQRFRDLRPATEYAITLHLVSPAGWDPALGTTIFVTTLPEGAEEVRVHEATRDSVSLRWLPPEGSTFRSVAVTTLAAGGRNESAAAWSEPCPRWPAMRCLTLSRLQADTRYDIWVHISTLNNTEVQVHTVHLEAKTIEGSPSAPRELRAEALSATALRLRWRAPAVRGGVLRNFVLIVHHVRSHATGACCVRNRIEVVEVPPADADRQDLFEYEVTGLPPASTFGVSLSAVTASAGAAANTTAHTAPLLPLLPAPLASSSASPLKLVAGPGACLRARLPPAAASVLRDPDAAPVRRLFTFLTPPEEEWSPWGKPANSNLTSAPAPAPTPARALPEELLRVLPEDYTALQEAQEAEDGTVCVGGAAGGGQRAGLALLLQYATAASAAVWRSDAFDLLDCFHAPAPAAPALAASASSPAASAGAFVCL